MRQAGDLHARDEASACDDGPIRHATGEQPEHHQHDASHGEPHVARVQAPALINRRTLSMVGVATLVSTLVAPASRSPWASARPVAKARSEGRCVAALATSPLANAMPMSTTFPGLGHLLRLTLRYAPFRLFPGFRAEDVQTSGATIHVVNKGSGTPLLLLHGHPETHVTWHKLAPALTDSFTVIVPDLRGYGDSSKPGYSPRSQEYSFRAMAEDMVEVMARFGHKRFMVAGHDRGGRVVHRMMLDHPEAVTKGAVLDIAPTLTMYDDTSKEFATRYVWWFLQIQPAPMPEHLISLDPGYYLRDHLAVQGKTPGAVTPEAMAEYIRCYCCKGTIRCVCEDYRAAAGIDLEQDRADDAARLCSRSGVRRGPSDSSGMYWPPGGRRRRRPSRVRLFRAAI